MIVTKEFLVLVACLVVLALAASCGGDDGVDKAGNAGAGTSKVDGDAQATSGSSTAEQGKLKAVIDAYYTAMQAGDIDGTFKVMTKRMIASVETTMSFLGENPKEKLAESYKSSMAGFTWEVLEEDFTRKDFKGEQQPQARVKTVHEGKDDLVVFSFAKVAGQWRIATAESRNATEAANK